MTRTTCPYCGVGCGVVAADGLRGDAEHPANFGRLCVKGAALDQTLGLADRLLQPRLHGQTVSWPVALDRLAAAFSEAIARHGPDSVAFYVSGQLLTEDYYVANKLMKGFIGSANIDTNSRLCMASSVAGHSRAFGADIVPGCYQDLELADLVVLVGANAAWGHPVLFQRLQAARQARPEMKLVVIDPRRTATAEAADLHLALRPGSDVALWNGLLCHLADAGDRDSDFLTRHTLGADAALAAAAGCDPAAACDLDPKDIACFYRWFAATPKVVSVYSQGVNQSTRGSDKVNAIINCHLLTGRIGRPGMGPLSFTGQPNAMGGREVGGLANQLAAHMGFTPQAVDRLRRFWGSPHVASRPGLKAVDLFQAVGRGQIKALWIMATNPAVSLPEATAVRAALDRCDFVALSDCVDTDSSGGADLLLPALSWGEKDGSVTNSERCISRQRAFLPPPGEASPDWWMICQLAARLGFAAAFDYAGPADIFREHALLSGFENDGSRAFDISGLAEADYETLAPVQWPVTADGQGTARLFGDGRFVHPDHRARLIATAFRPPASTVSSDWPLLLNTGRNRDQWHTMSRTGRAPRLAGHEPEPRLALHPIDAAQRQLRDDDWARVSSAQGSITLAVTLDPGQRPGEVFAPIHWNDQFAGDAVVGRLVAPHCDALSGQPELKFTPVQVTPLAIAWQATLQSRRPLPAPPDGLLWSRAAAPGHWAYRLSGSAVRRDWPQLARQWLGDGDWLEYQDQRLGCYRAARIEDGSLDALLQVAPFGQPPAAAAATLFATPLDAAARAALLGGGNRTAPAPGPILCACHGVATQTISDAISRLRLTSTEQIGRAVRAGTGCGSCLPDLTRLLSTVPLLRSAEA